MLDLNIPKISLQKLKDFQITQMPEKMQLSGDISLLPVLTSALIPAPMCRILSSDTYCSSKYCTEYPFPSVNSDVIVCMQ